MDQPLSKPTQPSSSSFNDSAGNGGRRRKLPTPEELIEHYESQGMDKNEASVKVIKDLQNALFRVVTSSSSGTRDGKKQERLMVEERSKKLDVINTRLLRLESKLDSRPDYGSMLAIGVTSGAVVRGFDTVFPQVVGAVGQIWNAVRATTSHK